MGDALPARKRLARELRKQKEVFDAVYKTLKGISPIPKKMKNLRRFVSGIVNGMISDIRRNDRLIRKIVGRRR